MAKILVTGADGFIGSHLVEKLVKDGDTVTAMVQYNSFGTWGWLDDLPAPVLKEINVICGDVRDADFISTAMQNIEKVAHLAALIAIPYSYQAPSQYIHTNILGTQNVLRAALERDTSVVHTSTSEVYGSAQFIPITERHPLVGQSPYSASKIGADQLAYSYYASFDLPVTTIRPFNTYGPRQSNRAVIPTIITQLLENSGKLKLGNLSATRDFNYIEDTIRGFRLALDADNIFGETINIGSGFELSIKELAKILCQITHRELDINYDEERVRPEKSEVNRLFACNKKAKELLKWSPEFGAGPGLKKGLEATVEWFSDPRNAKKYRSERYAV
jgi:dTDP-glucose 4,6-dehydratase